MANWLLVPSRNGRHTTPSITSAAVITDPDGTTMYLDCSRCTGIAIQQTAGSGVGGTFQLLETIDGTNFDNLGTAIVVSNGTITLLEQSSRPFGRLEVDCSNVTGLDSTHTFSLVFQGQTIGSGLN